MIKVLSYDGRNMRNTGVTLIADTKAEVPATGAATEVEDYNEPLKFGDSIITLKMYASWDGELHYAYLDSSDHWIWVV